MEDRMLNRIVRSLAAIVCAMVALSAALMGQAQPARPDARSLQGTENVKAFIAARVQKNWTPPTTPWGDPDISGVFTTKDEANTPFERPDEWAGRRIDDIKPAELAEAIVRRQEGALERGSPRVVPIHWFDNLAAQNKRPWFVIDPPEGKIPARVPGVPPEPPTQNFQSTVQLTQAAVDAADALQDNNPKDMPANRSLGDRCIVFGGLWRTPGIYGNSYQVLQTRDHVIVRYEMVHEARMIPLDGRGRPAGVVTPYFGISRGWWEGNTLVVETTNINQNARHRGMSAKNLRLVERFTRISPTQVDWSMTIDDPTVYTRPWTYSIPMTEDNSQLIFEYACHEGNFGMANLLTAGRLLDQKEKQAGGR
jgi:hypothetical protein